ncbi:MAG: hypothetical protein JEZ00_13765 [Anaerolineaceae bacterium]|nr:hypothetical protein [Anaerolineaceae bacterium]
MPKEASAERRQSACTERRRSVEAISRKDSKDFFTDLQIIIRRCIQSGVGVIHELPLRRIEQYP